MTQQHFPLHRLGLLCLFALCGLMSACTAITWGKACTSDHLVGRWAAHIEGQTRPWTLTLSPHLEHLGSLRGALTQGTLSYPVVADLDDGEFTMEESHDGQRITATWQGQVSDANCGKSLQGHRSVQGQRLQGFRLFRQP